LVAISFGVACGGDDDNDPQETLGDVTPVGTKEATPTPLQGGGNGGPPAPVEPELDEQLVEVTRGDREALIEPGEAYSLDPIAVAADAGQSPSCDNLQFDFSWQVTDPYPPDGVTLAWTLERDGTAVEVASGPAGNQAIGCGTISAENRGAAAITVAMKYLIGTLP
jgi:hypothetical protein